MPFKIIYKFKFILISNTKFRFSLITSEKRSTLYINVTVDVTNLLRDNVEGKG